MPALRGSYVLWIDLSEALTVTLVGKAPARLPAGRYLYCGSAHGPGGLRARVGRHMRRGKPIRWHVDRITEAGTVRGAWIFSAMHECDLVASLAGFPVPIPGFGSSDCRRCESHLLGWPQCSVLRFTS